MIKPNDSILIVVSHPDDEVLGMGGTGAFLSQKGIKISSCILSGSADARRNKPSYEELLKDINNVQKIWDLKNLY
jgi:LmbE family N-acetylglucosaminyl deacetylase